MFDAYFDDASQYCDCMLGNKLLESDEESALEGDGPLDVSQAGGRRIKLARGLQIKSGDLRRTLLNHHA